MEKVEWNDVQGLVTSGYLRFPHSAYVLWRFQSEGPDRSRWIACLAERLARADVRSDVNAINLAFTASGIKKLDGPTLSSFSLEFIQGMAPLPDSDAGQRRSNILGDLGTSSPERWDWGGWSKNREIDGVLLLFAGDDASLQVLINGEIRAMAGVAEPLDHRGNPLILRGRIFDDKKEHFGFRDGISQPVIEGSARDIERDPAWTAKEKRILSVKPGEFVLGYRNERRAIVAPLFKSNSKQRGKYDVRRNGSYLVFRQLEQNVQEFNDFVTSVAQGLYGNNDETARNSAAALLVGRTLDGDPLISRSGDSSHPPCLRNDFLYFFEDRFGLACPIGSHIRRANPRDMLEPDPDTALRLSKMHRIIRRGRPYGERFKVANGDPSDKVTERGMLFICLNADIAGQFEMIQHTWLNNRSFGGLYCGTDPLTHFSDADNLLTIQHRPTNLYVDRAKPFVHVRGGAYFFLPGINAVRALAGGKKSPE